MRDFINISSLPIEEECAQVGDANYYDNAHRECRAFIHQLRRKFGEEPPFA